MQNKFLLLVVIAVTLTSTFAAPSSSCDIDADAEGFDRFWQKTKCKVSSAADKVADFARDAYNATRDATDIGIQKTVEGTKDLYGKTKTKLKAAGTYVKDAFSDSDNHKSSEETEDARVVPLAGDGKVPAIPDIDIRTHGDDVQKTTKSR